MLELGLPLEVTSGFGIAPHDVDAQLKEIKKHETLIDVSGHVESQGVLDELFGSSE